MPVSKGSKRNVLIGLSGSKRNLLSGSTDKKELLSSTKKQIFKVQKIQSKVNIDMFKKLMIVAPVCDHSGYQSKPLR